MTDDVGSPNQNFKASGNNTGHGKSFAGSAGKKILLHAIILLTAALVFNALFNFTTLKKLSTESRVLKFHVVGADLQRDIEQDLAYDMVLADIPDMAGRLASAKALIDRLTPKIRIGKGVQQNHALAPNCKIWVSLPNGRILFSTESDFEDNLPFQPEAPAKEKNNNASFLGKNEVTSYGNQYFLHFPIENSQKKWIGSLFVSFDKTGIQAPADQGLQRQGKIGIGLFLIGAVVLLSILAIIIKSSLTKDPFPRKKITASMFYVIAPIIILFSVMNTYTASKQYIHIARNQVALVLTFCKANIEKYLDQGQPFVDAVKIDGRFDALVKSYAILDSILILDSEDNWIFAASKENINSSPFESYDWVNALFENFPYLNRPHEITILDKDKTSVAGTIRVRISKYYFLRESCNLILNAVTVIAVSILFLVELLIFLYHFIDKPVTKEIVARGVHFGLIRPVTFLFLFGMDLCMSFIPLHMEKLYTPIGALSKNTVMGLPISVEFCCVGITIFLSGFWVDRRGWHEPFLTGLFLAGSGTLYSWLAPDVIHFIISRGIVGMGYGLTLLAAQGFVIAFSSATSRARGFAQFLSGLYAGSICGGATGALLAEKIGYGGVFFIGAMVLYATIFYPLIFMRKAMIRPVTGKKTDTDPKTPAYANPGRRVVFKFFSNRIVLSLIFLSSLPAAFAAVGFLHYFSPVYLNRLGSSQGTIGRELMLYGFSLVYLGPVIARFVDKFNTKKNYVFVGCLLGSLAFLMFYFFEGVAAVTFAVLLLGLSNSFIIASQSTYLLGLKVTHAFGTGKAMGIFRAVSRLGQALGPIIFSGLFLSKNIRMSITYFGLIYLATAILFFIFTLKDKNHYETYQ